MKKIIYPSIVSGRIRLISSKSVAHRALICAALNEGMSKINNVDINEDIKQTVNSLKALGADIKLSNQTIEVRGFKLSDKLESLNLEIYESGSTLRFIIPLASLKSHKTIINVDDNLFSRPLGIYEDIFKTQNLILYKKNNKIIIKGSLNAANYQIAGNISSQFISGLLFILPLLNRDSEIEVREPFESKSYVNLTLKVMADFGVTVKSNNNVYQINSNQSYRGQNYNLEGDFSQLAFFAVLASINNDLTISNVNFDSVQGDKEILNFLKSLNVKMDYFDNHLKIYKSQIGSGIFDLSDTPDLGPIMCVLGLFSDNYIKLVNVERLKYKESNRLLAMKHELEKFGAKIILEDNSIIIYRLEAFKHNESVNAHNDHRIVMALSILATKLKHPLTINDSEVVNKSYPNFFNDLAKLNVKIV